MIRQKAPETPSQVVYRLCTTILVIVAKQHLQIFDVKKGFTVNSLLIAGSHVLADTAPCTDRLLYCLCTNKTPD